jgi:hypothetical protein
MITTSCLALIVDHVVLGTWYVIDLGGNNLLSHLYSIPIYSLFREIRNKCESEFNFAKFRQNFVTNISRNFVNFLSRNFVKTNILFFLEINFSLPVHFYQFVILFCIFRRRSRQFDFDPYKNDAVT